MNRLTRVALLACAATLTTVQTSALVAQQPEPDAAAAAEIRRQFLIDFDSLRARFVGLAQAIPDDKFTWRPAMEVRSISGVLMHVAAECYGFAPPAFRAPAHDRLKSVNGGRPSFDQNAPADKPVALKELTESCEYARAAIAAVPLSELVGIHRIGSRDRTIIETSFMVTADLHEHLGQLIAYARSIGVTPPWSIKR